MDADGTLSQHWQGEGLTYEEATAMARQMEGADPLRAKVCLAGRVRF